jgi:hypothetical protein
MLQSLQCRPPQVPSTRRRPLTSFRLSLSQMWRRGTLLDDGRLAAPTGRLRPAKRSPPATDRRAWDGRATRLYGRTSTAGVSEPADDPFNRQLRWKSGSKKTFRGFERRVRSAVAFRTGLVSLAGAGRSNSRFREIDSSRRWVSICSRPPQNSSSSSSIGGRDSCAIFTGRDDLPILSVCKIVPSYQKARLFQKARPTRCTIPTF